MSEYEYFARFAKANNLAAEIDMRGEEAYTVNGVLDWSAVAKAAGINKPSVETIKMAQQMLVTWRADPPSNYDPFEGL